MTRTSLVLIFLLLLPLTPVGAQVVKLSDYTSLSEDAVMPITFGPANYVDASNLYTSWGLRLRGSGPTVPRLTYVCFPTGFNPPPPPCFPGITNAAPAGQTSAGWPLVIDFDFPIRRIVFQLSTPGEGDVTARIHSFNSAGKLLGTIEQEGIGYKTWPTVGVETSAPEGISRLLIDYESSDQPEQPSAIAFDYVTRPIFRTFIPQVADGRVTGTDLSMQTGITILNLAGTAADTVVRFYESDGRPLPLVFNGNQVRDTVQVRIPAFGSQTVAADGVITPAVSGYCSIESRFPLDAAALFRVLDRSGRIVSEAGIDAETGKTFCQASATKNRASQLDTGFAIANISDQPAMVSLQITEWGPYGQMLRKTVTLLPGEHLARFSAELFEGMEEKDYHGPVLITSDQPVAITVLRTSDGIVLSSLPVANGEKWPSTPVPAH